MREENTEQYSMGDRSSFIDGPRNRQSVPMLKPVLSPQIT